ncbi:MAG TPA: flagellar basal body P-ring formation chaperone FlgA [Gemmatimonadaceae bacterium]|jgi:flagella basal body P-ring formation protein FlgA
MHRRLRSLQSFAVVAVATLAVAAAPVHAAGAQQATSRHVAFATHALARGAVLTADDFQMRDTTLRAPLDTAVVAAGWVTRRTIAAGEMLREPAVQAPDVIAANQSVEIEFKDANVLLTLRGTSTRSGALGERIPVRTEQGRRIEAVVVAAGRVRID